MSAHPLALLLDDDEAFGALLLPAFTARGLRLVQARRIRDVPALLAGAAPAVYLVDGLLPDGDGPSWIAALRNQDRTTPIAFVSAFWKDLRSFDRLRNELAVAVIAQKPVTPEVFAAQVRALVPPAGGTRPPAAPPPGADPSRAAAELARVRSTYAANLPEQVERLVRLTLDRRPTSVEEARRLAHQLRGTAGSYGFALVSAIAGRVEDQLVRGDPADAVALEELRRAAAGTGTRGAEPAGVPSGGRVLAVGLEEPRAGRLAALVAAAGLEIEVEQDVDRGIRRARAIAPDVTVLCGPSGPCALAAAAELRADPGSSVVLLGGGEDLGARVAAAHAGVALTLARDAEAPTVAGVVRQLAAARAAERPAVLVVDDDPAFADYVVAVLRTAGLRGEVLTDPSRLLEVLAEVRPDALLLDVLMPGFGGLDLCRMLRRAPEWQDLPILLVTAQVDEATRLAAFEAGADDHVPKPVLERELLARISCRVERRRLLRERSDRDALTGVASRRAFLEALDARLTECRRHGGSLAVAVLDLDGFKQVNDTHGHLTGDRVLTGLGDLLARRLRGEDLRCRWGGEEFAIALRETADVTAGVLRKLLDGFAALSFEGEPGSRLFCTFSAGVAEMPADGADARSLFEAADRRCYAAKRAGRARVIAADAPAGGRTAGGTA